MFFLLAPASAFAYADLEIRTTHIQFSEDTFVVGETVRIYATIRNNGDVDTTGYVAFYHGSTLLGRSQIVTVVADGNDEEVWADFIVPSSSFNIYVSIESTSPEDENTSNNTYLTPLYVPIEDQDGDGIEDEGDNCPSTVNPAQTDTDGDGLGDDCDDDDDNDGLEDAVENEIGTDTQDTDTDNDGVDDAQDVYPTDPTRAQQELAVEEVSQEPEPPSQESEQVVLEEESQEETPPSSINQEETVSLDTPLIERTSGNLLKVSPSASFVYIRRDWKTYEFEALALEDSYSALQWDFGDGTTSVQRTISHTYVKPGHYTVSLTITDEDGQQSVDRQDIVISLFHLANPIIQALLGILLLLLVLSTTALYRTHNMGERGQGRQVAVRRSVKKKNAPKGGRRKTSRK